MRIIIVGGTSSLAQVLKPTLSSFAEVLTAGRNGCDLELDLEWPSEAFNLPPALDVVVNVAAHFGGWGLEGILATESVNALGALKLCHAASKAQARHFIHISSTSAGLDRRSPYYGTYALSKRHGDDLVELHCIGERIPFTILRPSQLYGEVDSFRRHQPFLYGVVDQAMSNKDIVILGGRDALRNYLHAADFCQTVSAVIAQRIEGIFTCTTEKDLRLSEVAHAAIAAADSTSKLSFDTTQADIHDNVFPYDDTLYRLTGRHPEIGIAEGISGLVSSRRVT